MRNSRACPKCQGKRLWCVENFGVKDQSVTHGGGMPLRIVAKRPGPTKKGWLGEAAAFYDAGKTDAWICAGCGYTELWTANFESLVHNPAGGVHLVDEVAGAK